MNRLISIVLLMVITSLPMSVRAQTEAAEPQPGLLTSSEKGVKISTDVVAITLPVATLAYVLATKDREGLKEGAFTAAATAGATLILKYTVHKRRPDGSDFHSFPSGHTSVTFATAAFVQRRYGWKWGIPAYALAAYTGWGRTYAKKHDWWDVLAGAAIGAGSAYIFTRPFARHHDLTLTPLSDGHNFAISASFTF